MNEINRYNMNVMADLLLLIHLNVIWSKVWPLLELLVWLFFLCETLETNNSNGHFPVIL